MLVRRPPSLGASPLLRLMRRPTQPVALSRPRLFTQNHPLLLLTRTSSPRPQLPYLSQPSRHLPPGPALQRQLARLLTTETRSYVKEQTMLALKWSAVGWTMIFLLSFAWYGWQSELIERQHPSPAEWSYYTRTAFRAGFARTNPDFNGTGIIDWAQVGTDFRHCLERLENQGKDGQGLMDVVDGAGDGVTLIAGLGRAGYDISNKSYPWRSGYFEVLMGCARAAEFLDDMVRDKTRKLVFPKDVVIGPSNPNPRPVPSNMAAAPLEENCDRPYAPPETFYVRVLTGKGFSTRQKLDAALAYANWLEYKSAHATAEEVYRWAIDIAASALPAPSLAVDHDTGVLTEAGTTSATPNLLRASTAMATHFARTGAVSSALPVYLSVLRARRSAPLDPTIPSMTNGQTQSSENSKLYTLFRSIIRSSTYPPEGPTGDEPLLRSSAVPDCTEAELMLYIGEILFATAGTSRPDDGLGWTRSAVEIAQVGAKDARLTTSEKKICKDCLDIGMGNWSAMVRKMVRVEDEARERRLGASAAWKGWFGLGGAAEKSQSDRWQNEARVVEALRERLVREGITEQMALSGGVPGSVWIG